MANPSSSQDGRSWIKWLAIAGAVIVVGSGAWYAFGYFATRGSIDAAKDELHRNAVAAAGQEGKSGEREIDYSKVDVQTLTVTQFYDDAIYPQEYRVKWANGIIEQRGQKAHDELSSILVSHGYPALKPLVAPDISNTGSEILVQHDVVNYLASTNRDKTEGAKLLAASFNNGTANEVLDAVNKEPMVTFHTVPQNSETGAYVESPVFSRTAVGNYTPNGIPSKVIVYTNGITSKGSESIEQFIGGRWVTHTVMGPGDPNIAKYPQQIVDK